MPRTQGVGGGWVCGVLSMEKGVYLWTPSSRDRIDGTDVQSRTILYPVS